MMFRLQLGQVSGFSCPFRPFLRRPRAVAPSRRASPAGSLRVTSTRRCGSDGLQVEDGGQRMIPGIGILGRKQRSDEVGIAHGLSSSNVFFIRNLAEPQNPRIGKSKAT